MSGPDFRELVGRRPSGRGARAARAGARPARRGGRPAGATPRAPGSAVCGRQRLVAPPPAARAALVLAAALARRRVRGRLLARQRRDDSDSSAFKPVQTVVARHRAHDGRRPRRASPTAQATGRCSSPSKACQHLPDGDYYTLFMTRKGKPVVTCGTFNVGGTERRTCGFTVAYEFDTYDGLMLGRVPGRGPQGPPGPDCSI